MGAVMTKDKIKDYIIKTWETKPIHEICSDINISKWTFNRVWAEMYAVGLVPETKPYIACAVNRHPKRVSDTVITEYIKKHYKTMPKETIRANIRCGRKRMQDIYKFLVDHGEINAELAYVSPRPGNTNKKLTLSDNELLDLADTTDLDRHQLAESLGVSHSLLRHRLAEARKNIGVVSKFNGHAKKTSRKKGKILYMPWVDSKWVSNVKWRGAYGCSVC